MTTDVGPWAAPEVQRLLWAPLSTVSVIFKLASKFLRLRLHRMIATYVSSQAVSVFVLIFITSCQSQILVYRHLLQSCCSLSVCQSQPDGTEPHPSAEASSVDQRWSFRGCQFQILNFHDRFSSYSVNILIAPIPVFCYPRQSVWDEPRNHGRGSSYRCPLRPSLLWTVDAGPELRV